MNIQDLIRQRAIAAGVDPDAAVAIAKIESGFDPTSNQNASTKYKGLYQLGPDEWSQYGKGDIYDPAANADAFMALYKNNTAQLSKALGRQPTAAEAYLAHQQGPAGTAALLANPNQNAVDAIAQYYPSRNMATAAIKGNGGDPNGTAGDFVNLWNTKYGNNVGTGPAASYQEVGAPNPNAQQPQNAWNKMFGAPQAPNTTPQTGLLANNQKPQDPGAYLSQLGLGLLAQAQPQTPMPQAPSYIHRPQMYGNEFTGLLG
jgi:Transglycosylase SLT domain